jgi:hypothetical protein
MSNDMNSEQMQTKITAARREAEGLKDRIKRKKDDLADTSRMYQTLDRPVIRCEIGLADLTCYLCPCFHNLS